MGDVHGAHKALLQCLERSAFDPKTDRLIQLGDIVDGHDQVFGCVETLLTISNLVAIKGNHDEWLREFIETGYHPALWNFGGVETARSYLRAAGKTERMLYTGEGYKTALNPHDIPKSHRIFFSQQLLYFIDETNNCYVHGGFDRHRPIRGQEPEMYYWNRELWIDTLKAKEPVDDFQTVFLGHSSTRHWDSSRPMQVANVINLDTGAGTNGCLTIMDVQTKKFWQSDPVRNDRKDLRKGSGKTPYPGEPSGRRQR